MFRTILKASSETIMLFVQVDILIQNKTSHAGRFDPLTNQIVPPFFVTSESANNAKHFLKTS